MQIQKNNNFFLKQNEYFLNKTWIPSLIFLEYCMPFIILCYLQAGNVRANHVHLLASNDHYLGRMAISVCAEYQKHIS